MHIRERGGVTTMILLPNFCAYTGEGKSHYYDIAAELLCIYGRGEESLLCCC